MKVRTDFVTNSSSSSFVIAKKRLDAEQLEAIKKHAELGEKLGIPYAKTDYWAISEGENFVAGSTWMDNFDFEAFFRKIGVPDECIMWDVDPFVIDKVEGENIQKSMLEIPGWREILKNL